MDNTKNMPRIQGDALRFAELLREFAMDPDVPEVDDYTGFDLHPSGDYTVCRHCRAVTDFTIERPEPTPEHREECPILEARTLLERYGLSRDYEPPGGSGC